MPWLFDTAPEDEAYKTPAPEASVGALDLAKQAGSSAANLVAQIPSAAQYGLEKAGYPTGAKLAQGLSEMAHGGADYLQDTMSDGAKRTMEHPSENLTGYLAMQVSAFVPQLAAIIAVPEGPLAQGILGGTLQVGQVVDTAMSTSNKLDDEQLAQRSPVFADMLKSGMSPQDAREKLHGMMADQASLIRSLATGVATGVPFGGVVKGTTGVASALKGAGQGALTAAPALGVASGQAEYENQQGQVAAGMQSEVNTRQIGMAAGEGAVMGSVIGGVAGGAHGVMKPREVKPGGVEPVDTRPAQDELDALVPETPVSPPPETPPQVTQVTQDSNQQPGIGPKGAEVIKKAKGRAKKGKVEKVEEIAPAPDQAAALEAIDPVKTDTITEPVIDEMIQEASAVNAMHQEGMAAQQAQIDQLAQQQATATLQAPTPEPAAPRAELAAEPAPLPTPGPEVAAVPEVVPIKEVPGEGIEPPVLSPEAKLLKPGEKIPSAADAPPEVIDKVVTKANRDAEKKEYARVFNELTRRGVIPPGDLKTALRVLADLPEEEVRPRDGRTKATKSKIANDADTAQGILSQHEPDEAERTSWSRPDGDIRLKARLQRMLDSAERAGVEMPDKVTYRTPDALMWLRVAKDTYDALKAGKATEAQKQSFIVEDLFARKGEFDQMRARRKSEGDTNSRQSQGDIEVVAATEAPAAKEKPEVYADEVVAARAKEDESIGRARDNTPEVEQISDDIRAADEDIPEPNENWKPKLKEGEGYTAAKPVTKVKVETRNRVVNIPGKKPVVTARVAELKKAAEAKAKAEVVKGLSKDEAAEATRNLESIDNRMTDAATVQRAPRETVKPVKTVTVRQAIARLNPKGVNGQLAKKLMDIVGDIPVHIIMRDQMDRFEGETNSSTSGMFTRARTYNDRGRIIVRMDKYYDAASSEHVLLHEATHAAFQRVIETRPEVRGAIEAIANEVLREWGDVVTLEYGMSRNENGTLMYGEFLAEAFSNPNFQRILQQTPISSHLAAKLGLERGIVKTAWDMMVRVVRSALRLPEDAHSAMEAILKVGEYAERARRDINFEDVGEHPHVITSRLIEKPTQRTVETLKDLADQPGANALLRRWKSKLSTFEQLAQSGAKYFGESRPIQIISDLVQARGVKAHELLRRSEDIVSGLYGLEKKYKGTQWDEFAKLTYDSTMSDVHPDKPLTHESNKHLGKNSLRHVQARARHADLSRRWSALPDDLKAMWSKAGEFYASRQNEMSLATMGNILKAGGHTDPALAKRIFEKTFTEADTKLIGKDLMRQITNARELGKIQGYYHPMMRRGDYVVHGTYDIKAPAGATKVSPSRYVFADEKQAVAWAQSLDQHATVKSIWVDPKTGERRPKEDVTQSGNDPVQRFRVDVQHEHVEFHETLKKAEAAAKALREDGIKIGGIEVRNDDPSRPGKDLLSTDMKVLIGSLEKRKGYQEMNDGARGELRRALEDASIRFLGGTRVQSRRLARRFVAGASHDLVRNTHEYAVSTSNHLAKLEYQPQIDAALKAADDHREKFKAQADEVTLPRSQILREVKSRVDDVPLEQMHGVNAAVSRIMTLSFLDKLASPAFNIINGLQVAMVTYPVLAARHGAGRALMEIIRAYRDVGGLSTIKSGLLDTYRVARADQTTPTDYLKTFKDRLPKNEEGKRLSEMLDFLQQRGLLDADAGLEIGRMIRSREGLAGVADSGLHRVENIVRQLPHAIESMNRAVSAIPAYRMEYAKTGSHQKAMEYAQKIVGNTQGNYSSTNAPPIFKHPLAKLPLQFKKFGQMMYHLLGSQIGQALHGATREEKIQAWKTLAMLGATHTAMAGALGLPTEPFKILLMAAQAAGLSGIGWDDVERWERRKLTEMFGAEAGEVIARGLPRAVGVDLSSRVGMDSFLTFGSPRGNSESNVKSYLLDQIGGAPAGLVTDWVKGANAAMRGDFGDAAEKLVPFKALSDSIKAYRLATEGRKSPSGRTTMEPYGVGETGLRALGFTPARDAEQFEQRAAVGASNARTNQTRHDLMNRWQSAKPDQKSKVWSDIQQWNQGKDSSLKITMASLSSAASRAKSEEKNGKIVAGVRVGRNAKDLQGTAATYNVDK